MRFLEDKKKEEEERISMFEMDVSLNRTDLPVNTFSRLQNRPTDLSSQLLGFSVLLYRLHCLA